MARTNAHSIAAVRGSSASLCSKSGEEVESDDSAGPQDFTLEVFVLSTKHSVSCLQRDMQWLEILFNILERDFG